MNYVLAKRKAVKQEYFEMLLSNTGIYEVEDISFESSKAYSNETLIEDGEWFVIEDFSKKDFSDFFVNKVSSDTFEATSFSQMKKSDFGEINYICSYQDNNLLCFQKVLTNSMKPRKFLGLTNSSASPFVYDKKFSAIFINTYPDAIYRKDKDDLHFQKLEKLTTIFKGIDQLYKAATQKEVDNFLKNDFIKTAETYKFSKVTKGNRKRIASIQSTLDQLTPEKKDDFFLYAKNYCPELINDTGCFYISSESDLEMVTSVFQERFYTTTMSSEKRRANSIQIIQQQIPDKCEKVLPILEEECLG